MDIITWILSNGYTDDVANSITSGVKNVQVDNDNKTLTFTFNDDTTQTMQFNQPTNGVDGLSITDIKLNENNHLIFTMSDGTKIDAGAIEILVNGGLTNEQLTLLYSVQNKVDKDGDKVLSDVNFSIEDKNKVNNAITQSDFNSHSNNKNNPHETTLNNLTDINIVSLLDNQSIVYDSATSKWINKPITISESGKVKLDNLVEANYLNTFLDNATIQVENNKLVAKTLDGLNLTISYINTIPSLLNTITGGMKYKGTVNTKADLLALTGMVSGELYIVLIDESEANKRMSYVFNGTSFESLGEFGLTIRDFTSEPINLETETTGILQQSKMDLTGIAKITDVNNYMKSEDYTGTGTTPVNIAKTLDGLAKTVNEINRDINIDSIIAGDGIEVTKNSTTNIVTISSTVSGGKINLKSLPTFGRP